MLWRDARVNLRVMKIKNIFCLFKVSRKYEFCLFEGNHIMVNRDVKKMQEQGWELAGEISTKFSKDGSNRMLVPLKRRV